MYTVQCLVQFHRALSDVLIFEAYKKLRLLVLYIGHTQYLVGQQLSLYEVSENQTLVKEHVHVLQLAGVYRVLWQVPGNATILVGSPHATRQLRMQKIQDFKDVVIVDGVSTGHQVKMARLYVDRSWITTAALDGLAVVRDKSVRKVVAHIMTHHRSDLGSKKTVATKSGDLVVCLGNNGSLVATRFVASNKKVCIFLCEMCIDNNRVCNKIYLITIIIQYNSESKLHYSLQLTFPHSFFLSPA